MVASRQTYPSLPPLSRERRPYATYPSVRPLGFFKEVVSSRSGRLSQDPHSIKAVRHDHDTLMVCGLVTVANECLRDGRVSARRVRHP